MLDAAAIADLTRAARLADEAMAAEIESYAARTTAPGEYFDDTAAERACAFFARHLRLTEGEWAGRPFVLSAWERAVVRCLFGWKRPDGTRRFRRVYILVPKKNGKTEFGAGLLLLVMLGDGEIRGQLYTLAANKDQARISFNKACDMVAWSPALSRRLEVFKTSIYAASINATIKPLTGSPVGKHGFNVSGYLADEIHEYDDDTLLDTVEKNTAARRQPVGIEITTAGLKGKGYGWERDQHVQDVLAGAKDDHGLLPVRFAASDSEDWTDPAVWARANPGLGVSPKIEFIAAQCAEAKGNPRKENAFKRFHLDLWTEQAVRWVPLAVWDQCSAAPGDPLAWQRLERELRGRPCWGGLDLASTNDTCAWVLCFPPEKPRERWKFLYRCWIPEDSLETFKKRTKREDIDLWIKLGALRLTQGAVADYAVIRRQIERDATAFRLGDFGLDRWNATQMAVELEEDGADVMLFGQGYRSMSGPSKAFERLVFSHRLEHGNHPAARWMMGNTAIDTNETEDIKPTKKRSADKIDLVVAGIMALDRAMRGSGLSVYDRLAAADEAADADPAADEAEADADAARADDDALFGFAPEIEDSDGEGEADEDAADPSAEDEIDWAALNDIDHPGHAEAARRFRAREAADTDELVY